MKLLFYFSMMFGLSNQTSLKQLIFNNCNITSDVNWPGQYGAINKTILVDSTLEIDRFLKVDDVLETFTILGRVLVVWHSSCLKNLYSSEAWPKSGNNVEEIGNVNPDEIWFPQFRHRNSIDTIVIGGSNADKECIIDPSTGNLLMFHTGILISYCDLDFLKFPFDQHICSIIISSWYQPSTKWLQFSNLAKERDSMGSLASAFNNDWEVELLEPSHYSSSSKSVIEIYFRILLTRKGNYFVANIFTPGLLLVILQLVSFCFPPASSERAMYNITLLLSMFVLKSEAMSYLPKTPRPILVANYILAELAFSAIISIYSALICLLSIRKPRLTKANVGRLSLSVISFIDLVAFSSSIVIIIGVNLYTAQLLDIL